MKLSSNSVGMLIFAALATTVFVLMALRPAVDGNAMNLGVPLEGNLATTASNIEATAIDTTMETTTESPADATEETKQSQQEGDEGIEADPEEKPSESANIEPSMTGNSAPASSEEAKQSQQEGDEGIEADPEEAKTTD